MIRKKIIYSLSLLLIASFALPGHVSASELIPGISLGDSSDPDNVWNTVSIVLLITILSLSPAILIMMTCFTRIVIVLGFVRTALATQQMPPNQVLIALALFLSFFVMAPTLGQVNQEAVQPYMQGEITQSEALENAVVPIKNFMLNHTREKDLLLFLNYSGIDQLESPQDVPLTALIPAFAISELKTAFQMGFMIFIPFLIIDMVVSSVLMGMGMMMLPPVMISLPFKILLFILVDGWYLVVRSLLLSFNV